jgi:hypothetical protein
MPVEPCEQVVERRGAQSGKPNALHVSQRGWPANVAIARAGVSAAVHGYHARRAKPQVDLPAVRSERGDWPRIDVASRPLAGDRTVAQYASDARVSERRQRHQHRRQRRTGDRPLHQGHDVQSLAPLLQVADPNNAARQ